MLAECWPRFGAHTITKPSIYMDPVVHDISEGGAGHVRVVPAAVETQLEASALDGAEIDIITQLPPELIVVILEQLHMDEQLAVRATCLRRGHTALRVTRMWCTARNNCACAY